MNASGQAGVATRKPSCGETGLLARAANRSNTINAPTYAARMRSRSAFPSPSSDAATRTVTTIALVASVR